MPSYCQTSPRRPPRGLGLLDTWPPPDINTVQIIRRACTTLRRDMDRLPRTAVVAIRLPSNACAMVYLPAGRRAFAGKPARIQVHPPQLVVVDLGATFDPRP